jgi:hypothetical protein
MLFSQTLEPLKMIQHLYLRTVAGKKVRPSSRIAYELELLMSAGNLSVELR